MLLCTNLSLMFPEVDLPQRFAAAAQAGFDAVEIQFVDMDQLAALQRARDDAALPIIQINVPRGVGDEVGLASLPGREPDFHAAVQVAVRQARALDVRKVNILSGRPGDIPRDACWDTLVRNLRYAGDQFGDIGVRVMVEAINPVDVPGFFLRSLDDGLEAVARAEHPNVQLLFDLYHMAITEPDLPAAVTRAGPRIGHVQFADTPGRHEPGSGRVAFQPALAALKATGYNDVVSAEYRPRGPTADTLAWIPDFRTWTS